jgi:hypothetical protein
VVSTWIRYWQMLPQVTDDRYARRPDFAGAALALLRRVVVDATPTGWCLSDPAACTQAVADCVAELGRLDILAGRDLRGTTPPKLRTDRAFARNRDLPAVSKRMLRHLPGPDAPGC